MDINDERLWEPVGGSSQSSRVKQEPPLQPKSQAVKTTRLAEIHGDLEKVLVFYRRKAPWLLPSKAVPVDRSSDVPVDLANLSGLAFQREWAPGPAYQNGAALAYSTSVAYVNWLAMDESAYQVARHVLRLQLRSNAFKLEAKFCTVARSVARLIMKARDPAFQLTADDKQHLDVLLDVAEINEFDSDDDMVIDGIRIVLGAYCALLDPIFPPLHRMMGGDAHRLASATILLDNPNAPTNLSFAIDQMLITDGRFTPHSMLAPRLTIFTTPDSTINFCFNQENIPVRIAGVTYNYKLDWQMYVSTDRSVFLANDEYDEDYQPITTPDGTRLMGLGLVLA